MNIANVFRVESIALSNFLVNGAIGTAATTVDVASSFTVNQTTLGVAVTIPAPSNTRIGQIAIINNTGTAILTVQSAKISPQTAVIFSWNGLAWGRIDSLAFVGGIVSAPASRNITTEDDRMTLEVTGAFTLTVPTGLNSGFICRIRATTAAVFTVAAAAGMTLVAPFGVASTGVAGDYSILQIGLNPTIAYLN